MILIYEIEYIIVNIKKIVVNQLFNYLIKMIEKFLII